MHRQRGRTEAQQLWRISMPNHIALWSICALSLLVRCGSEGEEVSSFDGSFQYLCPGEVASDGQPHYPFWLADLREAGIFRSSKPRDERLITLVETVSLERLAPLALQCGVWPGIIAVAVYVPLKNGLAFSRDNSSSFVGKSMGEILDLLKQKHKELEDKKCIMDLAVYSEDIPAGKEMTAEYTFPANALRNRALLLAATEMVLLLDGDFLPGPVEFFNHIHTRSQAYDNMVALVQGKNLVVVPSLEFNNQSGWLPGATTYPLIHYALHSRKKGLVHMIKGEILQQFESCCHTETNWQKWLGSEELYRVQYSTRDNEQPQVTAYEPYVIAKRDMLPAYDERFRGYFFDKQSYLYVLYRNNFTFTVHPDAFVVHYPHSAPSKNSDVQIQLASPFYPYKWRLFFDEMPAKFNVKEYKAVRAAPPSHCKHSSTSHHIQDDDRGHQRPLPVHKHMTKT